MTTIDSDDDDLEELDFDSQRKVDEHHDKARQVYASSISHLESCVESHSPRRLRGPALHLCLRRLVITLPSFSKRPPTSLAIPDC
jgi:hypothetical protein